MKRNTDNFTKSINWKKKQTHNTKKVIQDHRCDPVSIIMYSNGICIIRDIMLYAYLYKTHPCCWMTHSWG